ncbi:MAG: LysM peptidoglycan-binding domain-containing protein [Flavobacteriales bacterium]|nr:LysM peptidoglycan-binding domain-containing protein [Flavobacteriales bacterium]
MIIRTTHTYIIMLFFLVLGLKGYGQADSLQLQQINGKDYYVHVVEKGESLYFIHKKYDVPLDVIKKENPGVNDGLSIGEKVFIPVKRDGAPVTVNGNFIEHTVEKKQTLYSIAKLYQVQQNEIIAANPQITEGLQEGQIIRIPVKKLKTEIPEPITPASDKITHVVQKGETLYALSKKYNVTVEAIKEANGGLGQGLREEEMIYIPVQGTSNPIQQNPLLNEVKHILASDTTITPVIKKPLYKIGLMLPFYLDENDEITDNRNALEKRSIYPKSRFAIEFYNGFVKALDSLTTDSCKYQLYVYDTKGNDSLRTKELLKRSEFKTFDLIVGPLYYNNFELVAQFAKENKIPIVSPVKQNNKILLGNPYVFKVIPSKTSILPVITQLVVDSFRTDNLMVLECEKSKEKDLADLYIEAYNKAIQQVNENDTSIHSSIKKIVACKDFSSVMAQCSKFKNNVIFVPTSDQAFITSFFNYLITTLNQRDYEKCKLTLIGLEEWNNFENIDLDYYQRLNVHFCTPQYINEEDSLNALLIKDYVRSTSTYPTRNAMLGFDLGHYFGNMLATYGSPLAAHVTTPYTGKSITLNFFKTGIESGFENRHTFLLGYYDYVVRQVSP